MSFHYQQQQLQAEDVVLEELAQRFGTPLYVYSKALIEANWRKFSAHWPSPHQLCYAVKANSNLAVLNVLAKLGAGFDIVSVGELERVIKAGGAAQKVVFSGVAKSAAEMATALEYGIGCFNVESVAELKRLNDVAGEQGVQAPVSLRVNPNVDAQTHPYIATGLRANKFGIAMEQAADAFREAAALEHIKVIGADCHIGSQLLNTAPFLDAADIMLNLIIQLRSEGIDISHLDMGGGVGIAYQQEQTPDIGAYLTALRKRCEQVDNLTLMLEPGRAIVGNAGVLLTQVEYLKPGSDKQFMLVDAGMNDLLRPSLYQAWHEIKPIKQASGASSQLYDVVGPVCETGDFLGHARHIAAEQGDILAVMNAGAYGFTMSSNYNSRPRAAEIMVSGATAHVIRERETLQDLWKGEQLLP